MIKIYLLTACITLIIFGSVYYNLLPVNIAEPYENADTTPNSIISNSTDTYNLQVNFDTLYKYKIKLNQLKETIYKQKFSNILKIKTIDNKTSDKFSVTCKNDFFDNTYIIEIPTGEIGPVGPIGEQGEEGQSGEPGSRGQVGNCGLLIK